jgi:hypothetical protein
MKPSFWIDVKQENKLLGILYSEILGMAIDMDFDSDIEDFLINTIFSASCFLNCLNTNTSVLVYVILLAL